MCIYVEDVYKFRKLIKELYFSNPEFEYNIKCKIIDLLGNKAKSIGCNILNFNNITVDFYNLEDLKNNTQSLGLLITENIRELINNNIIHMNIEIGDLDKFTRFVSMGNSLFEFSVIGTKLTFLL